MISALSLYERSFCDCNQCQQSCHHRPGALAPSDLDHIAEHEGHDELSKEFVLNHFEACCDGPGFASDDHPDGVTPVIRPKRKEDGACVFLTSEGKCSIHKAAPFECKVKRACTPEEGAGAMKALGKAIAKSGDYCMTFALIISQQNETE